MKAIYLETVFSLLLALCFLAKAEEPRRENLPSYCKSLFPKLLPQEKRPLSAQETRDLLSLAVLPAEERELKTHALSASEKRDLLERLILLRWQVPQIPEDHIPQSTRPQESSLFTLYPRASAVLQDNPTGREALTRSYLKDQVWKTAEGLAAQLGKNATAEERKEIFKLFLDHLDYHDQSWFHQSKIDTLIDSASGIRAREITESIRKSGRREFNELHQGEETYSFAGPELLLTPYTEILNLFNAVGLKPGDTVVDLGAGFGRVGLALATKYPEVSVTGYEIVKDRIEEGARVAQEWGLDSRVHLVEQNLADPNFKPVAADVYYAFNPVSGATFDKVLEDLRQVGLKSGKKFRFIVFGPSPFFKTDAQPWLKELKGPEIPKGDELKIYEFDPTKATQTVIVDPGKITNPYQLRPAEEVVAYPRTQPLTSQNLGTLTDHLASFETESFNDSSFMTPSFLAAWASGGEMVVSRHKNQLLISNKKKDEPGKEFYFEPLGGSPQEKADFIRKVIEDRSRRGIRAEFDCLSEPVYRLLQSDKGISSSESTEYLDFVYPAENLVTLDKTKKLRDRKNQAAAFQAAHPGSSVEILSELGPEKSKRFQETTKRFLDSWLSHKVENGNPSSQERVQLEQETQAAKVLSGTLVAPKQVQMAVWGEDNGGKARTIIAYAAGEVRESSAGKKTLIIYVQKSDGTKNVIPFINRELVREVVDHPEKYGKIDYVNMMDGTTPGLRQFKMQYEPDLSMGKTYQASRAD